MRLSTTYLELSGPFKLLALSSKTIRIIKQLKANKFKGFKKNVVWLLSTMQYRID